jgi:hypothetical protein
VRTALSRQRDRGVPIHGRLRREPPYIYGDACIQRSDTALTRHTAGWVDSWRHRSIRMSWFQASYELKWSSLCVALWQLADRADRTHLLAASVQWCPAYHPDRSIRRRINKSKPACRLRAKIKDGAHVHLSTTHSTVGASVRTCMRLWEKYILYTTTTSSRASSYASRPEKTIVYCTRAAAVSWLYLAVDRCLHMRRFFTVWIRKENQLAEIEIWLDDPTAVRRKEREKRLD